MSAPAAPQHYSGTIGRVLDGDTLTIRWQREETISTISGQGITTELLHRTSGENTFRLIIIDAPERGHPGYQEAKDFLRELLHPGEPVTFITHGVGDGGFGRTLADVYPSGETESLSSMMLRLGLAETWAARTTTRPTP